MIKATVDFETEEFQFAVGHAYGQDVEAVFLPHSCDEWIIAELDGDEDPVPKLERFIAEAQATLAYLRRTRPHGEPAGGGSRSVESDRDVAADLIPNADHTLDENVTTRRWSAIKVDEFL